MLALLQAVVPAAGPTRRLGWATLVNTLGKGLFLTAGVIFLVDAVGLGAGSVALALGVAAIGGLGAGVVVGDLADRFGPRDLQVAMLLLSGAGTAVFALADSLVVAVAAAFVVQVGAAGSTAARGAIIGALVPAEGRAELRAQLRSLTNVGAGVGALAATVPLALATPLALRVAMGVDGLTYVGAAWAASGLPRLRPTRSREREAGERRWDALADVRYVSVALLAGATATSQSLLAIGVPLLAAGAGGPPSWALGVLFTVNTVGVILWQVPVSRGVRGTSAAALALRRAGLAFLGGCVVLGLSDGAPVGLAVVLALVGVAVFTVGELWDSAADFELSFALAKPEALGQYQGVSGLAHGLADVLGPAAAVAVATSGLAGWAVAGGVLALLGAASPPLTRWAASGAPSAASRPA